MFHCFQNQNIKLAKRTSAKIITLIPLEGSKIIALDEHNCLTQYNIPNGKLLGQLALPFKARKLAAISNNSIIILAAQQRAVYEVDVGKRRIDLVIRFEASHHFNTQQVQMRQREYFTTMVLKSFNSEQACYLREERAQERRVRLHYLRKIQNTWKASSHEMTLNGPIADKFDEKSRLVLWKQQIVIAGEFDFSILSLETMTQEELHLQSPLFTLFTIVRAIRSTTQGILVCLNHKNPILLYFKDNQQRIQNIPTNLIWIINAQSFLITLCLSQQKSEGRIELRRSTGELMDRLQAIGQEMVVSRDGEFLLDYTREGKESGYYQFRTIRVLQKQKLYLHLMEKSSQLFNFTLSNGFMREVLTLLRQ